MSNTCSVKLDGTACLTKVAACTGYSTEADCVWATDDLYCYWDGDSCEKVVDATKCSDIAGTSANICKSKKSSCTWNSGLKCSPNCTAFTGPFNYDTC